MKAITLEQAEGFDRKAYDTDQEILRQDRINSTILSLNRLIEINLDDVKSEDGYDSFDEDFHAESSEWDIVEEAFNKAGFSVFYHPSHRHLTICLT